MVGRKRGSERDRKRKWREGGRGGRKRCEYCDLYHKRK